MSLLNDMLSDIAQASKNTSPAVQERDTDLLSVPLDSQAKEQRELFAQTSAARPFPRTLVPSVIAFLVVLSGFLGARYFLAEKDIQPGSLVENSVVQQHQEMPQAAVEQQAPIASPELGDRLAALESAVTTLTNVMVNTQQKITSTPEQETFIAAGQPVADQLTETSEHESPVIDDAASVSIQEPFSDMAINKSVGNTQINAHINSEPVADDALLQISPNPAWQDQQFAAQARAAFQAGQVENTIGQLNEFIASHPAAQKSTKLLLDILCEQESIASAQKVLTKASFLHPVDQTYYRAKIALLTGENAEAVAILESSLEEAQDDENYRALLAGLYQRTGMNQEAASHYRRLLNVFGEKSAYWLGFALAQDALNQSQLAFQAYQRVNQYSDLQPQVRQYVEQRLMALQQ